MRRSMTKLASVAIATSSLLIAGTAMAAGGERPQTWHLKSVLSHARQDYGATQDTHWFYADHPNPADPCGVSHTESGEQLITMRAPNTNINLTFHPNGTVTPATFTVPATLRRSATLTEDYSQIDPHRCPGIGMGTGTGGLYTTHFTDIPASAGGCGSIEGWAVITLRVRRNRLLMRGYFTQDGYSKLLYDPLGACPMFFGANPKPPEATGTIIDTSWPLSRTELYYPHHLAHFYDVNAEEEHVELKRYPGNPHGSTVTSMIMLLQFR